MDNMDGFGELTYNQSPLAWSPPPSKFALPGGVSFRLRDIKKDGTEKEVYYFDKDSPNFSRVHIYGEPEDVYTGHFSNSMFDEGGNCQFRDPDSGRSVRYLAI